MKHLIISLTTLCTLLTACQHAQIPSQFNQSDKLPGIYPDYINVTVPVNIAPLAFQWQQPDSVSQMVARYSVGDLEIICGGEDLKACPDLKAWKQLAQKAAGKAIQVEVYT